jgi:hypothetical protein
MIKRLGVDPRMTKSLAAALLLGLLAAFISSSARATDDAPAPQASQLSESKQFDEIKVTLDRVSIDGANADVVLRMDNLSDEEKPISFLLFIEAQSESGELGDYDYAKTNCDGAIPPKGTFTCTLALVFPARPHRITLRVGEGMAGDVVTFTLAL